MSETHLPSISETLRGAFESAWLAGGPPQLDQFLPAVDNAHFAATLEELVCIDLEFRWKVGGRSGGIPENCSATNISPLRIEAYLDRFEQLRREGVVERLAQQEYLLRHRYGDRPQAVDYSRRFPDLTGLARILLAITLDIAREETIGSSKSSASLGDVRLDRYRLRRRQGAGGFGEVWLADDPKLGREVAVKQMHGHLVGHGDLRRRFAHEARVAARLEHPGIVPIHDVGDLDGQQPYYTMKFVRGETLAEAIQRFHEEPLSTRERSVRHRRLLNAYLAVCRAMAYAHAQGVIHRDLKPQNIILGDYGETVIVDWGLAKTLHGEPATDAQGITAAETPTGETAVGTVQGTPAYMSPEQAAGRTALVDERSDVYALGVILYQITTGELPFAGRSAAEVLRQVVEEFPPAPRVMDHRIARPLEAICLRAIGKSPEARYRSAGELAQDIENFLADEPVCAHTEAAWEQAGRFIRRRRTLAAGIIVALAVAMCGLFAVAAVQQQANQQLAHANINLTAAIGRERDARAVAVHERAQAEHQRQRAGQLLDVAVETVDHYLVEIAADQRLRSQPLEPLRRQLLQDAEHCYAKLARQTDCAPSIARRQIAALQQLARVKHELGSSASALDNMAQARTRLEQLEREHPAEAGLLQAEFYADFGRLQQLTGDYSAARQSLENAVRHYQARLAPGSAGDPDGKQQEGLSSCLMDLGVIAEIEGDFAQSEQHHRQAVAKFEALANDKPTDLDRQELVVAGKVNLASLLARVRPVDEMQEVVQIYREAEAVGKSLVASDPHEPAYQDRLGVVYSNLAVAYRQMMKLDPDNLQLAKDSYAAAIGLQQSLVALHPDVVDYQHKLATSHGNLAAVLFYQQDVAGGEAAVRTSIDVRKRSPLGNSQLPLHTYAAIGDQLNLGTLLCHTSRLDEAAETLDVAARAAPALSSNHPDDSRFATLLGKCLLTRAQVDVAREDYKAADASYVAALDVLEAQHLKLPSDQHVKGLLLMAREQRGEALDLLAQHAAAE